MAGHKSDSEDSGKARPDEGPFEDEARPPAPDAPAEEFGTPESTADSPPPDERADYPDESPPATDAYDPEPVASEAAAAPPETETHPSDPAFDTESSASAEAAGEPPSDAEPSPAASEETRPREPHGADETLAVDDQQPGDEHGDEDGGRSSAGRVLTLLLILLIGAAIGIWGAPRLAPMLPSGLAPVAAWLAPAESQSDERLSALEQRVETGLTGTNARIEELSARDDSAAVQTAVADLENRLNAEIAALRDQLGEIDAAEIGQRFARLESAIDGQIAELSAIKEQLSGGAAATSALTEETTEQINLYRAEIDGLRAEMGAATDTVEALRAQVDRIEARAEREIQAAQAQVEQIQAETSSAIDTAALQADIALIRAALASGQPFAEPLARIEDAGVTVPDGLQAAADTGVRTPAQLRESFSSAAHEAIRASISAGAGEGLLARSRAFLEAQVASRSLEPQEGNDTDAVLSRMEDMLRNDNLAGAVAEAEQLPSEARDGMSSWLDAANLRLNAQSGLPTLNAELPATN